MTFTFPSVTDTIDSIRGAIGREVSFFVPTVSGCPDCSLDPITNTSTDSFCLTCSGEYWIETLAENIITGHVTWGQVDQLGWVQGGQLAEGDCRVQIKFTTANETVVDTASYLAVDGKKMRVIKKIYRGVPERNRILIDTEELDSSV